MTHWHATASKMHAFCLGTVEYDGAMYLCGYVIELALKARICKTLRWAAYPKTKKEFEKFATFKTHDLDVLLQLSGIEARIKTSRLSEWLVVAEWNPESRYDSVKATPQEAESMLDATRRLLRRL